MILIVFTPRAASTWFGRHIAEETGYEYINEPLAPSFNDRILGKKLEYVQNNDDIVMKANTSHWSASSSRLGVNAQLRSFYISLKLNHWEGSWKKTKRIDYNKKEYMECYNFLHEMYKKHGKLFQSIPNSELVISESFMTPEDRPSKPVFWDKTPPHFDIYTESFFR